MGRQERYVTYRKLVIPFAASQHIAAQPLASVRKERQRAKKRRLGLLYPFIPDRRQIREVAAELSRTGDPCNTGATFFANGAPVLAPALLTTLGELLRDPLGAVLMAPRDYFQVTHKTRYGPGTSGRRRISPVAGARIICRGYNHQTAPA